MSDSNLTGGTGDANGSGATGDDAMGQGKSDSKPESVSREDHERALADMHRFKTESRTLQTKLEQLSQEFNGFKSKVNIEKKDFESLFNTEKAAHEETRAGANKLKASVVYGERHRAVYPALKKAGLREDADNLIDHLDLDEIEIEATSSGRFLCRGIEAFTEGVKKKYPYAFAKPTAPNVNGSSGSGTVTTDIWTPSKLFSLEVECKKKGDMAPYKKAFTEYQQQKRTGS